MTRADLPRSGAAGAECIGLEEALKMTTEFSARSSEGEVPASLAVPVPSRTRCLFRSRAWSDLDDAEREAFRRFYAAVGEGLEDLAAEARRGLSLDDVVWAEITEVLARS